MEDRNGGATGPRVRAEAVQGLAPLSNYLAIEGLPQPMIAASRVLRELAGHLVEQLFSRESSAPKRPPDLTALLSPQEARALADVHLWKLKGTAAAAETSGTRSPVRNPADRKDQLKPTLKDLVSRAVKEEVQPREWQTTFHERLVQAVGGGTRGSGLPYDLEPVLEKAAWNDLRFRRYVTAKVHDYLREQVLFIAGDSWLPEFSSGTFWALIGMATVGEAEGQKTFTRMVREIREQARQHVMKEGWASFWDQWLIRLARQQWPQTLERDKTLFSRSLLLLPMLSRPSEPPPEQGPYVPVPSLWERIKRWFPTFLGWLSRKKREPLLKLKKTLKPLNLAHPDWEEQTPEFMRGKGVKEVKTNV